MKKSTERYVPALGRDALTSLYDPLVALTVRERKFKGRLLRQAQIPDDARVLDVGCGTATLTIRIAEERPRASVVGLDGDPRVLSIARRKVLAAASGIHLDLGLSFALPYADASFDRILSSLFFHHLTTDNKRRTILELHRVLKPEGQLHVADWGRPGNLLMRIMSYSIRLLDGFETTRDNFQGRLPALFRDGGFEDVRLREELPTIFGTLALYSARKKES